MEFNDVNLLIHFFSLHYNTINIFFDCALQYKENEH